ncbi:MAG: peptidyl-prolyl cis-trans isomerase [Verrucomicrobiaceae bacterium]|nr:peptidyl-prolyl cis-trans isomerase [Verrucomicrobiaceae bacterium]
MATPLSSRISNAEPVGTRCVGSDLEGRATALPYHLLVSLSPLLLLFTACSKAPPPLPAATKDGTPVIAMVGTEPITMASLQVIAAQNGYNLQIDKDRELAIRDAVNNEILAAKAKELGYEDDPDIRRYVKSQAVQKLLLATVDKEHQGAVPTEAELKAYYDTNLAQFTPPTLAKAQILGLLKRKGQEPQFAQKLDAVKTAIAAKQVPFSELVKQFSDDPAAQAYAGMTNWLVKGEANKQYPESVLKAVFEAKDSNEIVGPIEHNDWVYFVKQAELRDGKATAYDQAKAQIAQQMMRKKRLDAYNTFVEQLKGSVQVQTFPEKVAAEIQDATKQSGPPMGPVRTK